MGGWDDGRGVQPWKGCRPLVQNAMLVCWGFASMPSVKASRLSKVESRLDACVNRNRAARGVLINRAALHYKYAAPHGRDVFKRIPIECDDVRLQAGGNRSDFLGHAQTSHIQTLSLHDSRG